MSATSRSTVGDIVTRSARRAPSAAALAFEDRTWTYRELDDASSKVAAALLRQGLVKGDRVAAFGKNSDAYVLLWLGVAKAGLVHVPINHALGGAELAYIVQQSGARASSPASRGTPPAMATERPKPAKTKRAAEPAKTKRAAEPAKTKRAERGARAVEASESAPPFVRVWELLSRVPRGKVTTYGQLSRMIDRRLTPVGVGWAIRAAAEGMIPWQRVVNASGTISTDREHPGLQRALLESEGVRFDREGRIDLETYGWRPRT